MYMTIATADADGRPWVSPVWFAPRSEKEFLWVSSPDARHSRNIVVRSAIAIVIFDSTVPVGAAEALYLEAVAEEVSSRDLDEAIATYSTHSQRHGAGAWVPANVLRRRGFASIARRLGRSSCSGPATSACRWRK